MDNPYWPLAVESPVPYSLWLWWHWQFLLAKADA